MNNFKTIRDITEADADEFVVDIDDDEEELMAKAGKEAEFVDLHTAVSIAHPVAGDNQFKSQKDQAVTKNAESDNAEGEDKPVKQGTTGDTKFAQFRDKIGKTPTRKGDKNQGDKKAETIKEEVELDESVKEYDVKIKVGSKTNSYNIMAKDELSAAQSVLHSVMARSRTGGSPGLDAVRKSFPDMKSLKKKGISVSIKEELELDEATVRARYDNQKGVIEIHSKDYAKLPKEYKGSNPKKPTMLMMTKKGTSLVPVRFTDDDISFEEVELVKEEIEEGILELEDGEFVYVSDDDAEAFNSVLEELEPENRELMIIRMNENEDSYEEMLEFAKRTV